MKLNTIMSSNENKNILYKDPSFCSLSFKPTEKYKKLKDNLQSNILKFDLSVRISSDLNRFPQNDFSNS